MISKRFLFYVTGEMNKSKIKWVKIKKGDSLQKLSFFFYLLLILDEECMMSEV